MTSYLNQCISAKTQNKIDHCDETKEEYAWLILDCRIELKETTSRNNKHTQRLSKSMTGYSSKIRLVPKIIFFKDTSCLFINTDTATEILMRKKKKRKLGMGKIGKANHDTPSEFGVSSRLLRVKTYKRFDHFLISRSPCITIEFYRCPTD